MSEVRDELAKLASRAFTPSAARNQPLIHCRANENTKTSPNKVTNQNVDEEAATGEDESGDLLIRGFWTAGANCILDVRAREVLLRTDPVQSKCWSRRKKRRNENTLGNAWRITVTSHLSEAQTFSKRLAAKQESGSSPARKQLDA
jgi:hypothetical protein